MTVTIRLNGQLKALGDHTSLIDLLKQLDISPRAAVVERNRQVVERESMGVVTLEAGDEVEIIRIVGGG